MILREKSSMADTGAITLARAAANYLLIEGADVRLAAEARLGIAKLQIRAANPDAWFEQALGIAPPSVLTEIEPGPVAIAWLAPGERSEEHTSELQSLMRTSYAVFCLQKKKKNQTYVAHNTTQSQLIH